MKVKLYFQAINGVAVYAILSQSKKAF